MAWEEWAAAWLAVSTVSLWATARCFRWLVNPDLSSLLSLSFTRGALPQAPHKQRGDPNTSREGSWCCIQRPHFSPESWGASCACTPGTTVQVPFSSPWAPTPSPRLERWVAECLPSPMSVWMSTHLSSLKGCLSARNFWINFQCYMRWWAV